MKSCPCPCPNISGTGDELLGVQAVGATQYLTLSSRCVLNDTWQGAISCSHSTFTLRKRQK